jgi:hypothetical protein
MYLNVNGLQYYLSNIDVDIDKKIKSIFTEKGLDFRCNDYTEETHRHECIMKMFLYEINLASRTTPTDASSTGASSSTSIGYPSVVKGAPVEGASTTGASPSGASPSGYPLSMIGGDSYYDKYMKYKMKYLELKNR